MEGDVIVHLAVGLFAVSSRVIKTVCRQTFCIIQFTTAVSRPHERTSIDFCTSYGYSNTYPTRCNLTVYCVYGLQVPATSYFQL